MTFLKQNWFKFSILLLLILCFLYFIFSGEVCNVRGIELRGELVTYKLEGGTDQAPADQTSSDDIMGMIEKAESDSDIKAILLEIDSFGGSPVAAEEIAKALKMTTKPTVAQIRERGISAAYWAATGTNIIFASSNSDVGSIGVTMSYLQNIEKNRKEGLEYIGLTSGNFKDTASPDKPITSEEKKLLQRDLDIIHDNFVKAVAQSRNIPVDDVKKLADGSTMLGEMALQSKLIDKIGGLFQVKEYLRDLLGEEPSICWYSSD